MNRNTGFARFATLLLLMFAVSFAVLAEASNKWRLSLDGRAKVDGEIELSITPVGGTATNVIVAVPKGTSENAAAVLVRNRLIETFGKDTYHIETDDGEDVLVKAHDGAGHFELVVVRNTADGLRSHLHRE